MSTAGRPDRDVTPLVWIPGDQWGFHYLWEISGRQGAFVWIVAADVDVDGLPSYVVRAELRVGSKEMVFAKGHGQLGWYMEKGGNGYRKRASPPNFYLAWPLRVGQRWEFTYAWEVKDQPTVQQTRRCTVKGRELVTVPAGTFQTFRVVCTNERNEPVYMYWFAEAVKMFVKDRTYFAKEIRSRELTSYMLKEKRDPDTGEGDDGGADGDDGGDDGDGGDGDGGDDEFPK